VLLGVVGDFVGLADREPGIGGEVGFSAQGVPDPADPQFADLVDALDADEGAGGLVDEVRVDSVHQTGADLGERRSAGRRGSRRR
jgi:hypothetical protein